MIPGVNSYSSSAVSLLFATAKDASRDLPNNTGLSPHRVPDSANGTLKAGSAIGKIIEIVAGMDKAKLAQSATIATTLDAYADVDADGTGGTSRPSAESEREYFERMNQEGIKKQEEIVRQTAAGTGPQADRARAYLDGKANGAYQETDLATLGVIVTMTATDVYNTDGQVTGKQYGLDGSAVAAWRAVNTYYDENNILRDRATGKYAGFGGQDTKVLYATW